MKKQNPFLQNKNYVLFYKNKYHKCWITFDSLETIDTLQKVLKKASFFKIWQRTKKMDYVILTSKKRINDKIINKLVKLIMINPNYEKIKNGIINLRLKLSKDLEHKNEL